MFFNQQRCVTPEPMIRPNFNPMVPAIEAGEEVANERPPCGPGCGCGCQETVQGCRMEPIVHPCKVTCVERNIVHEVPNICPRHTKIINNHIYRHTFSHRHTCSEENRVMNVFEGSCCD